MKKTISILSSALILTTFLASCSQPAPASSTEAQASAEPSSQAASQEAATSQEGTSANTEVIDFYLARANEVIVTDTDVTFTDDSGRDSVTIPKNPQKVAVLYGSLACLWYEAGGEMAVGIGGNSAISLYEEQIGRNVLEDEGVVTVATSASGKNWSVEEILATQPDLIITATAMSGYSTMSAPAEAANIPIIAISYSDVQDYLKWFKVFSNLNSKPEMWDGIASETANKIIDVVTKVPETDAPPTVLILNPESDGVDAGGVSSQIGTIVNELGGVNVAVTDDFDASSIEISLEDMLATNPDIIFIDPSASDEETIQYLEAAYGGNPVWESLDAVKNGKVYYLPRDLFRMKPNYRYKEAYILIADYLYPDIQF